MSMNWMISRNGKEKQNESLNEKDPVDSIVEQSDVEARKKSAANEMRLKGMRIS